MSTDDGQVPWGRRAFGPVAEEYDRARPGYPEALVARLMAYAGEGGRDAVEAGAGTGKASVALAAHGGRLLCLEPDAGMAVVLRRRTARWPSVTVQETAFEDWRPPRRFGLLVAATAWHWFDPARRWDLAHAALAPGGTLALLWNPQGVIDPALHARLAAVDARAGLPDSPHRLPARAYGPGPGDWGGERGWPERECRDDGRFGELRAYRVRRAVHHGTADYLRFLTSVSMYQAMPPARRARALAETGEALDAHGGGITVDQITDLFLARALP